MGLSTSDGAFASVLRGCVGRDLDRPRSLLSGAGSSCREARDDVKLGGVVATALLLLIPRDPNRPLREAAPASGEDFSIAATGDDVLASARPAIFMDVARTRDLDRPRERAELGVLARFTTFFAFFFRSSGVRPIAASSFALTFFILLPFLVLCVCLSLAAFVPSLAPLPSLLPPLLLLDVSSVASPSSFFFLAGTASLCFVAKSKGSSSPNDAVLL